MTTKQTDAPIGYRHTLNMEGGQESHRFSDGPDHDWGICGEDYDPSYTVTTIPLYSRPAQGEAVYKGLSHSFSSQLKCDVVWNGDGDALAGFYGGHDVNGDYIDGEVEAKRYMNYLTTLRQPPAADMTASIPAADNRGVDVERTLALIANKLEYGLWTKAKAADEIDKVLKILRTTPEDAKGDVPAERGHDQTWGDRGGGQYWQSRCCNFTTIGNGGPYNTAEEAKAAARVGCLATQQPEHEVK